ncbi:hypothetical protein [Methylobacterium sp. Leaf91]|uniref:hypothetical protein n=1 Tax=Methylobacterium sp. Leaf91 TaxID=1736247 RepID=UPI0006F21576|nr:hypothetical protein [Methylobacterium sp. Leaf91]KQO99107.1 hypothetical protein ASF32_14735 [Methylobacterium sp. Leaf91]
MADVFNFDVFRGSNLPVVTWELYDEEDAPMLLAGQQFVLSVRWQDGGLQKRSADADGLNVNIEQSQVTWTPSLAESRMIPLGRRSRYELECRTGDLQFVVVTGSIVGIGGLNSDD